LCEPFDQTHVEAFFGGVRVVNGATDNGRSARGKAEGAPGRARRVPGGAALRLAGALLLAACGSEATPDLTESDTTSPDPCATIVCNDGEVCEEGVCRAAAAVCIDEDGDGYGEGCEAGEDCDDTRADVHPGRPELCNGIDDDCDFFLDEGNVCAPCTPECELGESFCSGDAITRCDDAAGCPQFARPEAGDRKSTRLNSSH
jgi:hypothetical protein